MVITTDFDMYQAWSLEAFYRLQEQIGVRVYITRMHTYPAVIFEGVSRLSVSFSVAVANTQHERETWRFEIDSNNADGEPDFRAVHLMRSGTGRTISFNIVRGSSGRVFFVPSGSDVAQFMRLPFRTRQTMMHREYQRRMSA